MKLGPANRSRSILEQHLADLPGSVYRHPWVWVCLGYCLLLLVREVTLVDGSLLNSYPFMFSDSFDYVFEGQALAAQFRGISTPDFPELRNPGYVLVQSLSHLSSRPELILFFITNTFVCLYLMTPFFLAKAFNVSNYALYTVGLMFLLNPSNDLFIYILSDAQAMSLMTLSVVCYMIHKKKGQTKYLALAAVLALLGALTQTYAAIPLLMYMGFESLIRLFDNTNSFRRRIPWKPIAVIGSLGLSYGTIKYLWMTGIPHDSTPANFSLLKLSISNLGFYLDTWGYLLILYGPVVVLVLRNFRTVKQVVLSNALVWMTLSIVLVFALLAFFYQWRDFRFTFSYLPLVFLSGLFVLSSKRLPRTRILLQVAIVQILFFGILAGGGPLDKSLQWIRISPQSTYVSLLIKAGPMDRGNLKTLCASPRLICEEATLQPETTYQERIFKATKQLHSGLESELP